MTSQASHLQELRRAHQRRRSDLVIHGRLLVHHQAGRCLLLVEMRPQQLSPGHLIQHLHLRILLPTLVQHQAQTMESSEMQHYQWSVLPQHLGLVLFQHEWAKQLLNPRHQLGL